MIGLVVVSHGDFARELVAAAEHVVGAQPGIRTVCIGPDDDMEQRRADIARAVSEAGNGDGAIILTDMFGGTPSNLAIAVMGPGIEVIAGVNLPMMVKLAPASFREKTTIGDAAEAAYEAGRKYIRVASWELAGEKQQA